jgi:hypothetical protein
MPIVGLHGTSPQPLHIRKQEVRSLVSRHTPGKPQYWSFQIQTGSGQCFDAAIQDGRHRHLVIPPVQTSLKSYNPFNERTDQSTWLRNP